MSAYQKISLRKWKGNLYIRKYLHYLNLKYVLELLSIKNKNINNPTGKIGKGSMLFIKEDIQRANKHIKRYPIS